MINQRCNPIKVLNKKMENAKINNTQLFITILLFEMGTSIVLPLGIGAENKAWLAILIGSLGGCILYLINYQLYSYYPDILPTSYFKKIVGKFIGSVIGFLYIVYFVYLTSRVLRDFGELLLTFAYQETPVFVINALMVVVVIYAIKKGIEVICRTGEIYILVLYVLAVTGFILILVSGLVYFYRLKFNLGPGIMGVLKEVGTQTLYVPFGEAIAFTYILPYINDNKMTKRVGISALILSGINLAITMAINVAVLSAPKVTHSPFPLLATIQLIAIGNLLERLDVFFLVTLFVGAFFKITIFLYVASIASADLFKLTSYKTMIYTLGLVVLFLSITIANNYSEHILEGLKLVPIALHLPFQVIIPILMLAIAIFRNRIKKRNKTNQKSQGTNQNEQNSAEQGSTETGNPESNQGANL